MSIWDAILKVINAQATPSGSGSGTISSPAPAPVPAPTAAAGTDLGDGRRLMQRNGQWVVQQPGWFFEEQEGGGPGRFYRESYDPWEGVTGKVYADQEQSRGYFDQPFTPAQLVDLVEGGVWTGFGEGGNGFDLLAGDPNGYFNTHPMTSTPGNRANGLTMRQAVEQDPYFTARNLLGLAGPGQVGALYYLSQMSPEQLSAVFDGMDPAYVQQVFDELQREQQHRIEKANERDLTDVVSGFMNPVTLALTFAGLPGSAGLTGAAEGASILSQLGSGLSGFTSGMLSPATSAKLIASGFGAAGNGGGFEEAARSFGLGQGLGMLGEAVAPALNDIAGSFSDIFDAEDIAGAAAGGTGERLTGGDMLPAGLEENVVGDLNLGLEPSSLTAEDVFSLPDVESNLIGDIDYSALAASATPPDDEPVIGDDILQPDITSADVQRYVKIGQAVNELLGSDTPEGAPQRGEGQTDEQYAQDLAAYMNLDAEAMAAQGLQPGSPEYMQYILQQADSIIADITEGMDVDAEDLSAQLRSKTAEEMQDLQRALFVRGTLQQMMGAGTYTDPFTGEAQDVIAPSGMLFNPNVAAYQRGLAGSFQNLGGSRDPLADINALLGRRPDLFGMQGRADQAMEQAKLEGDIRRRRGMLF